jgi:diguanylate cyclase (GGDEF)-like protein
MTGSAARIPHFPGSRYAAELSRAARYARFPAELEREYHAFYLAERRSHVRSFNVIMAVLVGWALLASLLEARFYGDIGQHLRIVVIELAYLAMAWAAYSRHYERAYIRTAHIASLVIALVGATEVAQRVSAGQGELFALLTPYSIGLYFLAGILYREALQANAVMVVAFCAALAWLGVPVGKVAYLTGILFVTAAIGGVAFRYQGIRFRRTFLERGLIAEMAARDGLTGLKNRRAFDEHLTRTWQQALRDRRPLVVMLLDVDHFKRYNDRYGHQAGDDALQRIATVVNEFAQRPLDLAARYGGEELAVVLFDVPREHAVRIAEQVRTAVQNLAIEHLDASERVVTISIGLALVRPTLERSPDGAVQLADEALYRAKHEGRNRLVVFEREHDTLSTGSFRMR